jgi:hypothetical protein
MESVKWSLLATAALALLVVTVTVPTFVFATSDEKADAQYDKGHLDQADKACEKGGYDELHRWRLWISKLN